MIVAGLFALLVVWSFCASMSISSTQAQVSDMQDSLEKSKSIEQAHNRLQSSLNKLKRNANILEKINSGVNISSLLAELSHIVDEEIVLTSLQVKSDIYKPDSKTVKSGVRFTKSKSETDSMPSPNTRFKIVINGLSPHADNITAFIARLEESDYFQSVIVGYLQNLEESSETKFEVNCYLNNYRIEQR